MSRNAQGPPPTVGADINAPGTVKPATPSTHFGVRQTFVPEPVSPEAPRPEVKVGLPQPVMQGVPEPAIFEEPPGVPHCYWTGYTSGDDVRFRELERGRSVRDCPHCLGTGLIPIRPL